MLKRRNITGKKILKMLSTLANLTPWSNAPISSFRLFNSEPGNRKQSFEWITVKLFLFFSCDAFFFSCELKCAVCNLLFYVSGTEKRMKSKGVEILGVLSYPCCAVDLRIWSMIICWQTKVSVLKSNQSIKNN